VGWCEQQVEARRIPMTKACAPGPPMDERPDDDQPEEDSGLIPQIDRPMSMPYLCCKLWRWKDLQ
ncbi:hypothetical protein TELCIR_21347, partial [Teladorsagia circumcincta]